MATDQQKEDPVYIVEIGHWKGWATTARGHNKLAPRQLRYLLCAANHMSHAETAHHEGVKPATVTKGWAAIYARLGIETGKGSAAVALAEAVRKGIITPLLILLTILGPMLFHDDEFRRPKSQQPKIKARLVIRSKPDLL